MLKILAGDQVKALDVAHCKSLGLPSLGLMEKAASAFIAWWKCKGFDADLPVFVFCGAGNNGGDGFAISRLLHQAGFFVTVFRCFPETSTVSSDTARNLELLPVAVDVKTWAQFEPGADTKGILIDSYLGVGFKGELRREACDIVEKINAFSGIVIAVDVPSGLPSDELSGGPCVVADFTVTFAFPKLSLLFPEHVRVTGEMVLLDIGFEDFEFEDFFSPYFFLRERDLGGYHRKFHRFSHKGDFGKVLIFAGSSGKMGASILSCKAALRTGSGLVTALIPEDERLIFQVSIPEAMCRFSLPEDLLTFDALGIGPGIGLEEKAELLKLIFKRYTRPVVLDADALTLLSQNPELIPLVPKDSILTPHLVEFDRILGKSVDHPDRLKKASDFCRRWKLNLLIKGANSVICLSDGRQIFNSSGTQFMATAGSGDVLTGMLTSFLGQGYSPEQAMVCGVFQHGLAGEIAGAKKRRGTIASDIVHAIPDTFLQLDIS